MYTVEETIIILQGIVKRKPEMAHQPLVARPASTWGKADIYGDVVEISESTTMAEVRLYFKE